MIKDIMKHCFTFLHKLETCNYKDRSKETFWDKVCDRDDFLRVYNGYMEDALTAACDVDGTLLNPSVLILVIVLYCILFYSVFL